MKIFQVSSAAALVEFTLSEVLPKYFCLKENNKQRQSLISNALDFIIKPTSSVYAVLVISEKFEFFKLKFLTTKKRDL